MWLYTYKKAPVNFVEVHRGLFASIYMGDAFANPLNHVKYLTFRALPRGNGTTLQGYRPGRGDRGCPFSQRAGTLHNALQNGPALFQQLVPDLQERRLGENT